MELTPLQRSIIAKIAKAEFRTTTQMISLLLAEGIRFYFCDDDARFGKIEEDKWVKELEQEAALEAGHLCFDED
jgi:predicted peroxiredoxin